MTAALVIIGCWLTGSLLLAAIDGAAWRRSLTSLPEAIAAGLVLGHLHFLVFSWLGAVPLWSYLLAGSLLGAVMLRRSAPSTLGLAGGQSPGLAIWAVPALLVFVQLLLLASSFGLPLMDWDARILWGFKAKLLATDGTPVAEAFRDPYRLHIHPRYPLLVPWLAALCVGSNPADVETGLRLAVLLCGALTLWHMCIVLWQRYGARLAVALAVVLISTGSWLQALFWLQVEVVLGYFLLLAVARVGLWLEDGRLTDLLMAALFLAGAVMTKNEGLLLAVLLPMAVLLSARPGGVLRTGAVAAGRLALATLLLSLPWFAHRAAIPAVSDENYLGQIISSAGWARASGRLLEVPGLLFGKLLDLGAWHLFWVVILPLAVWSLWPRRAFSRWQQATAMVILGYLLAVTVIYLFSPWRDIVMQIEVSCQRVLLPLLPAGLLLFGMWWGGRGRAR